MVKAASFELQTGEILGLFGSNGSGKSTLLKLLFGRLKADQFALEINNTAIRQSQIIPKKLLGYVPQHPFLPKNIKVRDLIPVYHSSEATQDSIFYDPHIATMTAKLVGSLSMGELKYFEVVLLSALQHPFLMLDEPFSMLEPLHKERLKHHLTTLKQKKGLLVTDHYYRDVLAVSDKNIVLKDGKTHPVNSEADLQKFKYLARNQYITN